MIFTDCKHYKKCLEKKQDKLDCLFCKKFLKYKQGRFFKDKYIENELTWLDGGDPI